MKIRLSSSKRQTLKECPYKLFLQQQQNIMSHSKSSALIHGSAWHLIMETFYAYIKDNGWGDMSGAIYACGAKAKEYWSEQSEKYSIWMDYRNLNTEMDMLMQYIGRYSQSDEGFLEVTAVEEKFEFVAPMPDGIDYGAVEEITYSGVIDLRCKIGGVPWLVDHKTTAGNITTESNKLNRSLQFIGYAYGEKVLYSESEGFMANFAGCSARKKKDGDWGKLNINFSRSPQLYTTEDYEVFLLDTALAACELSRYISTGIWPKNYTACYNYGRCGMYNQCQSGHHEPIEGYRIDPEPGSELTYE